MFTLVIFACGVAIGVVYQKALTAWKDKATKAVSSAFDELKK